MAFLNAVTFTSIVLKWRPKFQDISKPKLSTWPAVWDKLLEIYNQLLHLHTVEARPVSPLNESKLLPVKTLSQAQLIRRPPKCQSNT